MKEGSLFSSKASLQIPATRRSHVLGYTEVMSSKSQHCTGMELLIRLSLCASSHRSICWQTPQLLHDTRIFRHVGQRPMAQNLHLGMLREQAVQRSRNTVFHCFVLHISYLTFSTVKCSGLASWGKCMRLLYNMQSFWKRAHHREHFSSCLNIVYKCWPSDVRPVKKGTPPC